MYPGTEDIPYNQVSVSGDMFGEWNGSEMILKLMSSFVANFTSPEICYNYERMREVIPPTGVENQMVKYIFPYQEGESDSLPTGSEFIAGKIRVLKYEHPSGVIGSG